MLFAVIGILATSAGNWQSDYRRMGGHVSGRKEMRESQNLVVNSHVPIHCSLFVENFIINFAWQRLKIQGRVRPTPSEIHFRANAAIPATAGLLQ